MISKILPENKHKLKNSFFCFGVFLTVVVIGLPLCTAAIYYYSFKNRVYPRVFVCKEPFTGKNKIEAERSLQNLLTTLPDKVVFSFENEKIQLPLESLNYDIQSTIKKILSFGRTKPFFFNLPELIKLYQQGKETSLDFTFDDQKLEEEISAISAKYYQPALNPQIKIVNKNGSKTAVVEDGKNGREIDKRAIKLAVSQQIACPLDRKEVPLPIVLNTPKISKQMAESTKNRANLLLDKEIILKLEQSQWKIKDEEIISFLSFTEGFDRSKIADYAASFAKLVNVQPENATFQFENNLVYVFRPSKDGITLNQQEFTENLITGLAKIESEGKNQEIQLPITKTPPKISTGDVNSLGIKELLGRGTSLFLGSIPERIHNIQLSSMRLNGILIPLGEVFSFNKNLGEVSQDTGFKQAYIIKEGRTILGDGGGVCQVSTTLFRAALKSGLPITERHAHAYRVHYYENDLGPGFDATVFDPSADLKIKNDTPGHILIQTSIDLKRKQLTFELYGTSDGRKVEISKARVWDKQPPPPDLYQDDPTLPAGTIKQIDWKAWGSKAAFDYKVTRDGETLFEKTFSSSYRPWQAVYLRGTGR